MTRTDPLEALEQVANELFSGEYMPVTEHGQRAQRQSMQINKAVGRIRAELVRRPSDLLVSRIVAAVMRRYPIWHMEHDLHFAGLERKKMEADVRALLDGSDPTAGVPFRDDSDTEPFDPDLPH